jgi:hypothetical protein
VDTSRQPFSQFIPPGLNPIDQTDSYRQSEDVAPPFADSRSITRPVIQHPR